MEIKIDKVVKNPNDTPELLFGLYQIIGKMTIREMTQKCKVKVEIVPLEESDEDGND